MRLKRTHGTAAGGMYLCSVFDAEENLQIVHVGIFNEGQGLSFIIYIMLNLSFPGAIMVTSGNITLTEYSDLNGVDLQFTLTCISTGGPATTVTWIRDSTTITEGTKTMLDDPVTAHYTHTLNVIAAGEYNCTVANKAFSASTTITLTGINFKNKFNVYKYILT